MRRGLSHAWDETKKQNMFLDEAKLARLMLEETVALVLYTGERLHVRLCARGAVPAMHSRGLHVQHHDTRTSLSLSDAPHLHFSRVHAPIYSR